MKNLNKHESSATFYPLSKNFFFTGGDNMITLWGKKVKIVRKTLFLIKKKEEHKGRKWFETNCLNTGSL